MGGGFGGKETQTALFACGAALAARKTGAPVKLRLDRDDDMRSPASATRSVRLRRRLRRRRPHRGARGHARVTLRLLGGPVGPVDDRAIFHVDNAYWLLETSRSSRYRCKTNTVSDTAFRGFGGPQGMIVIEGIIDDIARTLGLDPLDVRRRNLYGTTERNVTHYGMRSRTTSSTLIADELEAQQRLPRAARAIARVERGSPSRSSAASRSRR